MRRMLANYHSLVDHDGLFFDHWRRRLLAAFGVKVE